MYSFLAVKLNVSEADVKEIKNLWEGCSALQISNLSVAAVDGVSSDTKLQINIINYAQSDQFLNSAIQQYGKIDNVLHFEASCLVTCRMVTIHHLLFPEDERSRSSETFNEI